VYKPPLSTAWNSCSARCLLETELYTSTTLPLFIKRWEDDRLRVFDRYDIVSEGDLREAAKRLSYGTVGMPTGIPETGGMVGL